MKATSQGRVKPDAKGKAAKAGAKAGKAKASKAGKAEVTLRQIAGLIWQAEGLGVRLGGLWPHKGKTVKFAWPKGTKAKIGPQDWQAAQDQFAAWGITPSQHALDNYAGFAMLRRKAGITPEIYAEIRKAETAKAFISALEGTKVAAKKAA